MKSITVYCSSSSQVPAQYLQAAADLGMLVARAGWRLVYGGNSIGCMKSLADAARSAGGPVLGITPQRLVDLGIADQECQLIVCQDLRERKALLEENGDGFVALPGGLGTLEEIFDIIVAKSVGYHRKPVVLLNLDEYYRPLLAMIEHGIELQFIKPKARDLFHVAANAADAIAYLRNISSVRPSLSPG